MNNYIFHYIKHNIRKCAIMLFLLSVCSTLILFTLDIIFNLITEINYSWRDDVSKEDLKTMVFILECGIGIIIGFCYLLVDNTYSVILRGREKEFNLLNNIGFYRKKIKWLLIGEGVVLGTIALGVGLICSRVLSVIFMKRFELFEIQTLSIGTYIIVGIGFVLTLMYVISKDLKGVSIGLNQPNHKKEVHFSKNKVKSSTFFCILGSVLAVIILLWDQIFQPHTTDNKFVIMQMGIFALSIILALDGWLYWLFILLRKISLSYHKTSLYLAVEQCIYNFNKIKSVMNSIIIAVMLLVGFLGLFESIKGTTRKYVNESVNYDYMVICDTLPETPLEFIRKELDKRSNDKKYYALALTVKTLSANERIQIFTGIDEDYYKLQRLYLTDQSDINQIYNEEELSVLYSSKAAMERDIKIGDTVSEYRYEGKVLKFRVGALYDPINLKQGFTSRRTLSKVLYGAYDKYNTIFFEGFNSKEVDEILNRYHFQDYSKYDMGTVRKQAVDQTLNGTEMIEVLLYTSMFFVASLVVNMFVLSFTDRIKQYTELMLLGTQKKVLIFSMLLESIIIFIGGSFIGYLLGIPFIKGALAFMESELIFETVVYIPIERLLLIITSSFIGMLACTYVIGRNILQGNILKYNYRE